ncbi:hypothetical protein GGR53DRAFT_462737 [Hypoxylon sp. FL1150]|nr:hypothetical protein GGR53DRAFT_462737 [Hypoxylon sp. FL1150]
MLASVPVVRGSGAAHSLSGFPPDQAPCRRASTRPGATAGTLHHHFQERWWTRGIGALLHPAITSITFRPAPDPERPVSTRGVFNDLRPLDSELRGHHGAEEDTSRAVQAKATRRVPLGRTALGVNGAEQEAMDNEKIFFIINRRNIQNTTPLLSTWTLFPARGIKCATRAQKDDPRSQRLPPAKLYVPLYDSLAQLTPLPMSLVIDE